MSLPLVGSTGEREREIDLGELARLRAKLRRIRLYGWLGLLAFCAVLSYLIWSADGGTEAKDAVDLLPLIVGGLSYFLICREPYGQLSRLGIGPTSIHLFYTDGQDEVLGLTEAEFGVNIVEVGGGGAGTLLGESVFVVETRSARSPIVTRAIAEEILAVARDLGVPILVRDELRPVVKGVKVVPVTRVGRPEQTPGWSSARPVRQAPVGRPDDRLT